MAVLRASAIGRWSRYICCNLILNSSTPIDSFQSQSLFGSVNVGSAGIALLLPISSFSRLMSLWWLVWLPLSPSLPGWSSLSLHYLSPSSWLDGPAGWRLPLPPPLIQGSTCWLAPPHPPSHTLPSLLAQKGKGGGGKWGVRGEGGG